MNPLLHPYQHVGSKFLSERRRAYIADAPGLGKSAQIVTACDQAGLRRGVVICPAFLRTNWTREFDRWQSWARTAGVWASTKDPVPDTDVVCVSYDMISKPVFTKWIQNFKPEFIACDEAHYLKTRTAKRTRAVFGRFCRGDGLMALPRFFWLASGTPMLGTADDLYTWMRAWGLWDRNYYDFVGRYCKGYESPFGFKITGNQNTGELKARMKPVLLRRTLSEVEMELPDIEHQVVTVDPLEMDPFQSKIKEMYIAERGIREVMGDKADVLERLHELTRQQRKELVWNRQNTGMLKLRSYVNLVRDELDNLREYLGEGQVDKIVIFAIHRQVIQGLRIFLENYGPQVINGGTPVARREKILDRFQHSPNERVLICNINAAGVGLNITASRFVDILEPSWTPAENEQAIKRLHRIGQKRKVRARWIGLAGSIDEHITETLARKTRMINEIIG